MKRFAFMVLAGYIMIVALLIITDLKGEPHSFYLSDVHIAGEMFDHSGQLPLSYLMSSYSSLMIPLIIYIILFDIMLWIKQMINVVR